MNNQTNISYQRPFYLDNIEVWIGSDSFPVLETGKCNEFDNGIYECNGIFLYVNQDGYIYQIELCNNNESYGKFAIGSYTDTNLDTMLENENIMIEAIMNQNGIVEKILIYDNQEQLNDYNYHIIFNQREILMDMKYNNILEILGLPNWESEDNNSIIYFRGMELSDFEFLEIQFNKNKCIKSIIIKSNQYEFGNFTIGDVFNCNDLTNYDIHKCSIYDINFESDTSVQLSAEFLPFESNQIFITSIILSVNIK